MKNKNRLLFIFMMTLWLSVNAVFAQNFTYPIQEFRLGISNTNRNLAISNVEEKSVLTSSLFSGSRSEKWYLNFVSSGVHKIVNSLTGHVITDNNGLAVLSSDVNGANQRFKIVPVEKDFEAYDLYYKIVSHSNPDLSLTFNVNSNSFSLEPYSGNSFQKFKINLDGMEGYAANSMVSGKEKAGTIGGLLGETKFVSTKEALIEALNKTEPLTIVLTENLDLVNQDKTKQRIRDNKTLVGSYSKNTIYDSQFRNDDFYGQDALPSNNIVIRNINFVARSLNSNGSGMVLLYIYGGRNIWIDHNDFSSTFAQNRDAEVGKFIWINTPSNNWSDSAYNLINPDYITISYNYFKNRYWTVAFGSQNKDTSRLRTTLMFNKWEQCSRRTPQYSNGYHHNYSSFHTVTGSSNPNASSQVIAGEGSRVLNENCRFEAYTGNETSIDRKLAISFEDRNSYTANTVTSTPVKLSVSPLGSSWNASDSYGYSLVAGYNSTGYDTKKFCDTYSGTFKSYEQIKYITDDDLSHFVSKKYESSFLKNITVGNDPIGELQVPASIDTSFHYTITNLNSSFFLSTEAQSLTSGSFLVQSLAEQVWTLKESENGYYYISPSNKANHYLELLDSSVSNGVRLQVSNTMNAESSLFKFVDNKDGSYSIVTKISNDNSCLGVAAASKEEQASVVQWECNDSGDQKWVLNIKIEAIHGSLIQDLIVKDTLHSRSWRISENVKVGDLLFGDRDFTYTRLPDFLVGAEAIMTACDSKMSLENQASFVASTDITVYVAFDNRVRNLPAWISAWKKTAAEINSSNDVVFDVYQADFKKGDTVLLGTNGQISGSVNYTVFASVKETNAIKELHPQEFQNSISVYLFSSHLLIKNQVQQSMTVALFSLSGQKLYDFQINQKGNFYIELKEKYPKGVYYLQIKSKNQSILKKILFNGWISSYKM